MVGGGCRDSGDHQPYPFGVHRDLVRIYLQTAQGAITAWLACLLDGRLEELVHPSVTEEAWPRSCITGRGAQPPWPQSLEELQEALIDSELTLL